MPPVEHSSRRSLAEYSANLTPQGEARFQGVVKEFSKLAAKPMAGDRKMGAFYTCVNKLVQTDEQFNNLIRTASERETTTDHLANLLLRGVQYVEIFEKRRTGYDDSFLEPEAWEQLLTGDTGVVTNHEEQLLHILQTKETTTTKWSRYAGVKAALNAVFPDQQVRVADFGCGANYGLQGLRGDIPFPNINVDTNPDGGTETGHRARRITRLLDQTVRLEEGLAVDKTDPSGDQERRWRVACSFYPSELSIGNLEELTLLEDKVRQIDRTGMRFLQGDLLELQTNHADGTLPEEHFDAVVMSTVLYQMTQEQQTHMIKTAKKSLNTGGVIILQDFAHKSNNSIGIDIAGLNPEPYSYRTFVMGRDETEWREFLKWETGRCRVVLPGEDFDRVKPVTTEPPTGPFTVFTSAA